jgi:hypothetical protein
MPGQDFIRYWTPFQRLIPNFEAGYPRVTHPFATLLIPPKRNFLVRLACMKHAASVCSEPGSNSPKKIFIFVVRFGRKDSCPLGIDPFSIAYARYLVFKDPLSLFTRENHAQKNLPILRIQIRTNTRIRQILNITCFQVFVK